MKLIFQVMGFLAILAALLVLPDLGGGGTGIWGWIGGLFGWILYYRLIDFIYRHGSQKEPD
jgi:hypothetical protein